MREKNLNGKLMYLLIGTALAIISSVITTFVAKIYEEYENRKVLFYKISDMGNISEKVKAEKVYQRKIGCTISYNGRGTASFTIYFNTKDGYSISDSKSHPKPEELPPTISKEQGQDTFTVKNFRETQRIDFDIEVKSDKTNMPIPSDVLRLKIIPFNKDNNLIIKQLNWKYYIDKWNIYFILILIVIIIVLVLLAITLYVQNRRLKGINGIEYYQ